MAYFLLGGVLSTSVSINELSRTLASLYPDEEHSRRVVHDAGINEGLIRFSAAAVANWSAITRQAQRESRLAELVAVAKVDYPENSGLVAAASAIEAGTLRVLEPITADNISAAGRSAQAMGAAPPFVGGARAHRVVVAELWSGELEWRASIAIAEVGKLWETGSGVQIAYPETPFRHPEMSEALLRLSLHGRGGSLFVREPDRWAGHLLRLIDQCLGTGWSDKGKHLAGPTNDHWGFKTWTEACVELQADAKSEVHSPQQMATLIHTWLDAWVMKELGDRLRAILEFGDATLFRVLIEPSLAEAMAALWSEWRRSLDDSVELRAHFLRVILSTANREQRSAGVARLGPLTVQACLVHSIVFALAVAAGLPRDMKPMVGAYFENFATPTDGSGHLCGLELVDSLDLSVKIRELIWRTGTVLISHYDGPGDEIAGLSNGFRHAGSHSHRFDNPLSYSPLFFTYEPSFRRALSEGLGALQTYLRSVVERWHVRQQAEVDEAAGGGGDAP